VLSSLSEIIDVIDLTGIKVSIAVKKIYDVVLRSRERKSDGSA